MKGKTCNSNLIDMTSTYYHVNKIFLSIHYAPACIIYNSTLEHPVAILQALQWVPLLMLPCRLCKTSLSVNCTFNHFMCFNTRASQILLANLKDLDRTLRALGTLIGEGALKLFVFCHRGCEHITHNQPSLAIFPPAYINVKK